MRSVLTRPQAPAGEHNAPRGWLLLAGLGAFAVALGLLAILAAGFAGIGFIGNGDDGASLGMSLAFAVALAAYVVLVFALAPPDRSSTT